jgi:hypothetical protein
MSLSFWGFVYVTLVMLTDLSEIRPILPQLLDGKLSIAKGWRLLLLHLQLASHYTRAMYVDVLFCG